MSGRSVNVGNPVIEILATHWTGRVAANHGAVVNVADTVLMKRLILRMQ